ncbi:MAG: hypothetical protein FWC86_02750 [Coriobacteriia bacterium]|nr:hypothetical protein [Coriobacteriia bacterium]
MTMTDSKFCPHCGEKQEEATAFCGSCGKNVTQATATLDSESTSGSSNPKRSKKPLIIAAAGAVVVAVLGIAAWQLFFTPLSFEEYSEQTTELWREFFEASLDAEVKLSELEQDDYDYDDPEVYESFFAILNDTLVRKQSTVNQIERIRMPDELTEREERLLEEFLSATSSDIGRYIALADDLQDLRQHLPEHNASAEEWTDFSREYTGLFREHLGAELHEEDFIFRTELRLYSFLEQSFDGWDFWLNDTGHQVDSLARRLGWDRAARNFRAESLNSWRDYENFIEEVNFTLNSFEIW